MTTLNPMLGAPSARYKNWKRINWDTVNYHVRRLQLRIAKAVKQGLIASATPYDQEYHEYFIKREAQKRKKKRPG